jgi:PleD family two-component response regulator
VAEFMPETNSFDQLVAMADEALYVAKHSGRNCVAVYGKPPQVSQGGRL